ncbi:hypothetical protein AOCH_006058 [Aspergillus ochraceoroseus]|uniref:Uncharacterized protein n=1 Tax=Aspergillus ochraceoroseus TaxID=138278 RepID=A0A0F8X8C1_9EURO|nr:hypothetical protein AOCH_006058 [Aspergillus ochraceoroseus]
MKAFRLILALGALCTSALGTAVDVDFAKRDIFVPEWEFELTPGGEKVYLNGTAQEVHRELLSRNPKWNEDFGFDSKLEAHAHEKRAELAKRTDFSDAATSAADAGSIAMRVPLLRDALTSSGFLVDRPIRRALVLVVE